MGRMSVAAGRRRGGETCGDGGGGRRPEAPENLTLEKTYFQWIAYVI